MADLSKGGVHEYFTEPLDDATFARLNPQWSVIVGSADKPENSAKSQAFVLERRRRFPRTAFGVRWWHERDDKLAANFIRDYGTVEKAADEYARIFFPLAIAGTWLMVGNEESADENKPAVFKANVDFHTAVVRRATDAGIDLGCLCMAMGEPQYGQYELMVPLLRAMQDGRARGRYHLWRPNTYFPHSKGKTLAQRESERFHLALRHQREMRRVAALNGIIPPPVGFGEFNTVVSAFYPQNTEGPNAIPDYPAETWMDDVLWSTVAETDPVAFFNVGDGLFDTKWGSFRLTSAQLEQMITRMPRTPLTLIDEWKAKYVTQNFPFPTSGGERVALAEVPNKVSVNIRAQPNPASASSNNSADAGDALPGDEYTWYPNAKVGDWVAVEPLNQVTRQPGQQPAAKGWVSLQGGAVKFVKPLLPEEPTIAVPVSVYNRMYAALLALEGIRKELPPASGGTF